jgi:hypothetical protein
VLEGVCNLNPADCAELQGNNQTREKMKTKQLITLSCLIAVAVCAAEAQVTLTKSFNMPLQVNGSVTASDCNNSPGPQVTLDGEINLGGLQVQLIFQNNIKGTHRTIVTSTSVVVLALGESITIPKQPVRGGAGGNPHILIQFHDGNGSDLSDEIYLGRCVQGLRISPELLNEVLAAAEIDASDCSNHQGPWITLGGSLTFSGLHARIIFRNNLQGTHEADVERDVTLITHGSKITIPKQPVRGGAGGNPIIYFRFLQGDGTPIGDPVKLGRCVQL